MKAPETGKLTEYSRNPSAKGEQPNPYRFFLRILLTVFFIVAGILHFLKTPLYLTVMPPWLPYHLELVYISGIFEILGGIGVLIPALQRYAGFGLIVLVIAVSPANIQMAIDYLQRDGLTTFTLLLLLRLPMQLLIIYWIHWCTKNH